MPDEVRSLDITEVDPATRTIRGRDEHGQLLAVTSHFINPLITVPQVGEKWLVYRQGNQWLLDRRYDQDNLLLNLNEGDVHIDAKNNLIITAPKILVNGQEISNDIKVSADDQPIASGSSIRFRSNALVTFRTIPDYDANTVDV